MNESLNASESNYNNYKSRPVKNDVLRDIDRFLEQDLRALLSGKARHQRPAAKGPTPALTSHRSSVACPGTGSRPEARPRGSGQPAGKQAAQQVPERRVQAGPARTQQQPQPLQEPTKASAYEQKKGAIYIDEARIAAQLGQQGSNPSAKRQSTVTPLLKSANLDISDSMDLEQRLNANYLHQRSLREKEPQGESVSPQKVKLCQNLFNLISLRQRTITKEQLQDFVQQNKLHPNAISGMRDLLSSEHHEIDYQIFERFVLKRLNE